MHALPFLLLPEGVCELGEEQSPIDIDSKDAYLVPGAQPFVFVNYNLSALSILLDEHTVKLMPSKTVAVGVAAGGIRGFYSLDHIHFHWPSEHTVDGIRFPLEVHFVHYNSIYPSLNAALPDPAGVAVIAVLFTEGSKSSPIGHLIEENKYSQINAGPLSSDLTADQFLPADSSRFYRYHGSLTTPPCSESVMWSVLKSKPSLSSEQIGWFEKAPLKNGPLTSNFRPIQDAGFRDVELWVSSYKNKASVSKSIPKFLFLLLLILAVQFS
ncbi:carbonic anhydrase 6-like isoform X2 [Rhodnius prolixus]|uniref:carbonic anhydrase 6-like isoform X2 n=1 Tax=Rhodnius prolixus TaxID=13249 RepID=UPI003D18E8A4